MTNTNLPALLLQGGVAKEFCFMLEIGDQIVPIHA